ncbi:hypothetical protein B4135_0567 [Caldibacillus debilis]|uniref:Uncharacterized protein n=1 Tax=Caldibacillus debilis TaxID=301148 RepID=A0A150MAH7_9BACI|nr:hypothetical protein B4135_0567 [Caldibacillus debilis]
MNPHSNENFTLYSYCNGCFQAEKGIKGERQKDGSPVTSAEGKG